MKKLINCVALATITLPLIAAAAALRQREDVGERRKESAAVMMMTPAQSSEIAEVRAVLDNQVAAWNRGDVDAFMDGYARSAETTFISGVEITRGWQTVLERYRKNYSSREKMGTLAFSELDIKLLAPNAALVLGRWQLTRSTGSPWGRFSLTLAKTPLGWRITHDHTSSATRPVD